MTRAAPRFDRGTIAWMGSAHFVHDTYPAFIGVLLPILIARFELSLFVAALIASGIRWTSMLQPLLGYMTDRADARRYLVLGSGVTAVSLSLLANAPTVSIVLGLLLVAGVSHATFHPAAASLVTQVSADRWGKGLAIFMTGGELGRAIGPLFIALILTTVGLAWSWLAVVPGLLMTAMLAGRVRNLSSTRVRRSPGRLRGVMRDQRRPIALLGFAITSRSVANTVFLTFLPTMLVGGGSDLIYAGAAIAAYELGGAAGALLGGTVSDRYGRRAVMTLSLILGLPGIAVALVAPVGAVQLGVLTVAGFWVLSAMPVQLATMHELLPDNRGMATGLVYFTATLGAIGSLVVLGALADMVGLLAAIRVGLVFAAIGIVGIWLLPRVPRGAGRALTEAAEFDTMT